MITQWNNGRHGRLRAQRAAGRWPWATGTATTCPSTTGLAKTFPICRPVVRVVLRPDLPQPALPDGRHVDGHHPHHRPSPTPPRWCRPTARSWTRSTATASRGWTTTPTPRASGLYLPVLAAQPVQDGQDRPVLRRRGGRQAAGLHAGRARLRQAVRGGPPGHLGGRVVLGQGGQRGDAEPDLGQDRAHLDLRRARRLLRPRAAAGRGRARRRGAPAQARRPALRLRPLRLPGAGGHHLAVRQEELRLPRGARPHVGAEPGRAQVEPAGADQP